VSDVATIPTVSSLVTSAKRLSVETVYVGKRVGLVAFVVVLAYGLGNLINALLTLALVAALGRLFRFAVWARKRRADLRAAGRPVPSLRALWAIRRAERKRLAALVTHWPSRCTENGIKLDGRAPVLVDHALDLDGNITAKLIRTGFDPDDVKAKAHKLAKGLGCKEIVVRETSPGCADVSFLWTDPLGAVLPLRDLPLSGDGRISFGVTASGEAATLEADLSTIFAGVTRSGKSNAAEAALADLIRKGDPTRLYISNPKQNELRAFSEFVGKPMGCVEVREYAETEADNVKMVANFENSMRVRASHMKGRKITRPTKENPRSILWLDEMFLLPKDIYAKGPFSPLGRILAAGGASLHTVFGCTQLLYSADLGSIKGLFSQRVAFRTTSEEITDTILGNKATARGAKCHKLHKTRDRGVGYAADQEEDLVKFRAAKVTDADLWRIIRGLVPEGMKTEPDPEPDHVTVITGREKLTNVLIGLRCLLVYVLAPIRRRARGVVPAAYVGVRTLRFLLAYSDRAVRIRMTEPLGRVRYRTGLARAAVRALLHRKARALVVSAAVFAQVLVAMAR
jgi:hypothetical protein